MVSNRIRRLNTHLKLTVTVEYHRCYLCVLHSATTLPPSSILQNPSPCPHHLQCDGCCLSRNKTHIVHRVSQTRMLCDLRTSRQTPTSHADADVDVDSLTLPLTLFSISPTPLNTWSNTFNRSHILPYHSSTQDSPQIKGGLVNGSSHRCKMPAISLTKSKSRRPFPRIPHRKPLSSWKVPRETPKGESIPSLWLNPFQHSLHLLPSHRLPNLCWPGLGLRTPLPFR